MSSLIKSQSIGRIKLGFSREVELEIYAFYNSAVAEGRTSI